VQLGMLDNIEELAPTALMQDSEWSISATNRPVSEESDSSEEGEDLFGTSFL